MSRCVCLTGGVLTQLKWLLCEEQWSVSHYLSLPPQTGPDPFQRTYGKHNCLKDYGRERLHPTSSSRYYLLLGSFYSLVAFLSSINQPVLPIFISSFQRHHRLQMFDYIKKKKQKSKRKRRTLLLSTIPTNTTKVSV